MIELCTIRFDTRSEAQLLPEDKKSLEGLKDHIHAESLKPGPPRKADDNASQPVI